MKKLCRWFRSFFKKKNNQVSTNFITDDEKIIRQSFWVKSDNVKISDKKSLVKYHPNPWWWIESNTFEKSNRFEYKMMRPQWGSSYLVDFETWKVIPEGWNLWYQYNNLYDNKFFGGHAWQGFIRKYKSVFEKDPELLALVNNKRVGIGETSKLCVSNPKVISLYSEYVESIIKLNPNRGFVSMEPSDGANFCQCQDCKKIGGISDQVYHLVNRVAKKVKINYPNIKINLYAYYLHSEPPKEEIEDNIVVAVIPTGFQTIYSPEWMLSLWREKYSGDLYWRDYFGIPQWTNDFPRINVETFLLRTNLIKKLNYKSIIMECGNNLNAAILTNLFSQIWDYDVSFGDVYDKFLNDCFPTTRIHIENLFDKWYQTWFLDETANYSLYDLTEALTIVKDSNERTRILDLVAYTILITKRYDWSKNPNNKDLIIDYFDWVYKIGCRNLVNPGALWETNKTSLTEEVILELEAKYSRSSKLKEWVPKLTDEDIEDELIKWLQKNKIKKLNINKVDSFESHMLPFNDKDFLSIFAFTLTTRRNIEVIIKDKIVIENIEQTGESLLHIHNKDFSYNKTIELKTNKITELELPNKYDTYRIWCHRKNVKIVIKGLFIPILGEFNEKYKNTFVFTDGRFESVFKIETKFHNRFLILNRLT